MSRYLQHTLISVMMLSISGSVVSAADSVPLSDKKSTQTTSQPEYPPATPDEARYMITLFPKKDEQNYQVELLFSTQEEIDCNIMIRHSDLIKLSLSGWGYDYYRLNPPSAPIKTLMGCSEPPKIGKVDINVSDSFINYNSKLPIVVYAPKNVMVKYRLWSTKNHPRSAESF